MQRWWIGPLFATTLALSVGARDARADLAPARAAITQGEYAQAETLLRAATGRERAEADALLGRVLIETGRYADARTLAQRLQRTPATRVDGFTIEGEALAALGQYDDAIARWRQALDSRRVSAGRRARALAGQWSARLGRRDQAEELAQPLVDEYNDAQQEEEDHPRRPTARTRAPPRCATPRRSRTSGWRCARSTPCKTPTTRSNASIAIDRRRAETLIEHAELFLSKEDLGHAGESLREALAINANNARARLLMAQTRLANDMDFNKANEDLDAALRVNPEPRRGLRRARADGPARRECGGGRQAHRQGARDQPALARGARDQGDDPLRRERYGGLSSRARRGLSRLARVRRRVRAARRVRGLDAPIRRGRDAHARGAAAARRSRRTVDCKAGCARSSG
jgi:tetratricopeptide (TPR) repeat protein